MDNQGAFGQRNAENPAVSSECGLSHSVGSEPLLLLYLGVDGPTVLLVILASRYYYSTVGQSCLLALPTNTTRTVLLYFAAPQ